MKGLDSNLVVFSLDPTTEEHPKARAAVIHVEDAFRSTYCPMIGRTDRQDCRFLQSLSIENLPSE